MDKFPGAAEINAKFSTEKLHLPPLRSLDDFLLGSARFQLPNLKDIEKWGNRVVKNLLYYQTNYFLLFLILYVLLITINPFKIIMCILIQALVVATVVHIFFGEGNTVSFVASKKNKNKQTNWLFLAGILFVAYILLYWNSAVLLSCFIILLPISLTFIHASLRLRNMKNKVVNTMERIGPATPMGAFLDALNLTSESI